MILHLHNWCDSVEPLRLETKTDILVIFKRLQHLFTSGNEKMCDFLELERHLIVHLVLFYGLPYHTNDILVFIEDLQMHSDGFK